MNYTANLITHRTEPRIAVQFENNKELIARFKVLPGARWSATLKCWHLPDTEENRKRFNIAQRPVVEPVETTLRHFDTSTSSVSVRPVVEPVETTLRHFDTSTSSVSVLPVIEPVPVTEPVEVPGNGAYMYILLCANGNYYTGSTNNLKLRLQQHQNGEGANFTKKHLPVELVYFETFNRIDDAFNREKQVQGWSRAKKEALINNEKHKLPELSKSTLHPSHFDRLNAQSSGHKVQGTGAVVSGIELVEMPGKDPSHFDRLNAQSSTSGKTKSLYSELPETHKKAVEVYIDLLRLENYSANTINTYRNWFTIFLRNFAAHEAGSVTKTEIMEMLVRYRNSEKWSATGQNQLINAIKFYYEKVLKKPRAVYDLPRADKPYQLPTVFDQSEIKALFDACTNVKHKTMLMLAYAGGLRVSEIVNLKLNDIDSKRMVITLRQAKGKKDRQVMLSEKLLLLLRNYFKEYQPKEYLFEGQTGGAYTSRSIELVIKEAKKKAGIKKKGSIHALRHSFATHLLESGTDIMSIKELLGHTNIQTTSIYTHVSKKQLSKIISPLDKLI